MNRREMFGGFFGSVLGWFGLKQEPEITKGFIVHYVNVGCLPPFKVEAYCEHLLEKFKKQRKATYKGWGIIIQPVRPPQETRIEIHSVSGNVVDHIKPLAISQINHFPILENTPKLRENTKDYCLLMLGAPVVTVNLDDDAFNKCFDATYEMVSQYYHGNVCNFIAHDKGFFMDGVLARCMFYLSRINKDEFMAEAARENLQNWYDRLDVNGKSNVIVE